jgi:predicted GH43/DUF377 family glycosyl hydrolase
VRFNEAGDPTGAERLGIALEPEADYERRLDGGGGCEDPRVTFVEPLKRYIMTYAAFSPHGPRIAMAESEDLFHWKRLGLATYAHWHDIELAHVDDKDASIFPVAIPNSAGKLELGMLHRPLFPGTRPEETVCEPGPRQVDLNHESIWISYCPPELMSETPDRLGQFTSHHRLATPVSPWERLKIGAGTPPILTKHGWLIVYHGVSEVTGGGGDGHHLCYSAGVMVLSKEHPREIRYRDEQDVAKRSDVETFCALRLFIDSWRWEGVQWYLRSGKYLPDTATEVLVELRPAPQRLFADSASQTGRSNYFRFRLSPDPAIAVAARVKLAGQDFVGEQRELYLSEERSGDETPYERLLGDAMVGDGALFTREDAVEAAWVVVDPVLKTHHRVRPYKRRSWGPKEADTIIAADGGWHNPNSADS